MIARPSQHEYNAFYAGYVGHVPADTDVLDLLARQPQTLRELVSNLSDAAAGVRPALTEWSVKEVIGHMADTERVFAYRLLRIARGDTASLPGFDQDAFMANTDLNRRTLADLLDEFDFQRRSNLLLVKSFTETEIDRTGTASDNPITARALVYLLAGHAEHHIISLRTDYKVAG